ncbi:bZIP transcription factor [Colletotrichum tabaci]|uniref:BZIP transcription factor n=1 Tax=Colletotrichum tabaci TaxID=1209068 RepID=A0AAV9TN99_9PEZI
MAQSGYPGPAPLVEARHMSLSLYDISLPEQTPFLSPANDYHLCQQWPGHDFQIFEPAFSPGNPAGSMDSIHWEGERQSHQSSETTTTTTPGYSVVGWAPRSDDWSSYQELQQNLQQPRSAVFSQPPQWPTPAASPLAVDAAWQPATSGPSRPEPDSRTATTKKQVTLSARELPGPHRPPKAQHRTKRSRVEAGSEPSPVTPISYDEDAGWVEGDNEGEDSDTSRALRGPERKKTYRVKNRAAAKRCREKTKQYEMDLSNKEKQVTQERLYLDACVAALKNEVLTLRNQILEHGSCDCEMIQGYIARTASSVGHTGHRVPAMLPPSA